MAGFYEEKIDEAMGEVRAKGAFGDVLKSKKSGWWTKDLRHGGGGRIQVLMLAGLLLLLLAVVAWLAMSP
ncbi:MAG: hypothetical protein HY319_29095 [Armatimonadetes bacterium]|nr:hypothetical protein [Armatimonadota bacterium]